MNVKQYLKYDYDANGNQLSKVSYQMAENTTSPAEYGTVQLGFAENRGEPTNQNIKDTEVNSYNGFNQLIRADIGYTTAEYAYRPDGLRMSKTVNKETTFHLWDGSNIVADLNSNFSVKDKYLRGMNLIKNNSSYYLFNAHGDVVQLANASGVVTKSYKYDAFGVETDIDETDRNPFRYCGEYFDLSSGKYYLRNRYYSPGIGRFITEDPAQDGLNWYTYVVNSPLMFIDPTGLIPSDGFDYRSYTYYDEKGNVDEYRTYYYVMLYYLYGYIDESSEVFGKAIDWWAANGRQMALAKFDYDELTNVPGFENINNGSYDLDRYDKIILAMTNFVNELFGTDIDGNDIKALIAVETKMGYYHRNDYVNGSVDIMQSLTKDNYAIQRLAARGIYDPNEAIDFIPKSGYGLFQRLYPDGNYDRQFATVEMSVLGGIIWFLQYECNFAKYNGKGDPAYINKINGTLKAMKN